MGAEALKLAKQMNEKEEKRRILDIIDAYVCAFEMADANLMESLFWVDDSRFIEVENHIPKPFGRERFLWIMDWMRKNQRPRWKIIHGHFSFSPKK